MAHHNRVSRNNCSDVYANAYLITTAAPVFIETLLDLMDGAVVGVTAASRTKTKRPNDRARFHRARERKRRWRRRKSEGNNRPLNLGSTRWMGNDCERMYIWYNRHRRHSTGMTMHSPLHLSLNVILKPRLVLLIHVTYHVTQTYATSRVPAHTRYYLFIICPYII